MNGKKVLFVCKNNVFRSRVAEEFFKKLDKKNKAQSAGLIRWTNKELKKDAGYGIVKRAAKKHRINLANKSKGLTHEALNEADIIIICADDVPKKIIGEKRNVRVWKVRDLKSKSEKETDRIIREIKSRVKSLVEELK